MKKFLVVILLVLIVAFGFIGIRFGSALFQEEKTTEIIATITKLEFSNSDYIQIHSIAYTLRIYSTSPTLLQVKKFVQSRVKD